MTHIVFQEADVAVLQKAIELDESLKGDIIQIKDDYAVGPIETIYQVEGWQQRKAWWQGLLQYSPYTEAVEMVDDRLTIHKLIQLLQGDESVEVWIWMGQNQHDVCGYYWLMTQLSNFQGRIQVLYLNNLPFINEKGGIFYPTQLHEIQPKEFLKAKKLVRTITLSEFEIDPDEWKRLCSENAMVRILEGGKKIAGKDADFYDKDILASMGNEPLKLQRLLSNILGKMKIKTGDAFLAWRIRQMIDTGALEAKGNWEKGWKDVVVRAAGLNGELFLDIVE